MLPKILLTRSHPRITLNLGSDILCIEHRTKYLDFVAPCQSSSNYVLIIPYDSVVVAEEPMEPIKWLSNTSIGVYALFNNELAFYELSINPNGKAMYTKYRAGEEILRGVVMKGDGVSAIIDLIKTLIDNYLKSSFLIYSAYVKSSVNTRLIDLSRYKVMTYKRVRVYGGDGIMIFREGLGSEESISIVSTIDSLNDFRNILLMLIKASRVIYDVKLGRVGHGVKTLLDMYMGSTSAHHDQRANQVTVSGHGIKALFNDGG